MACNAQKMKFFMKDFFSKCDHIRRKLLIWSHLLMKSLMQNFILWGRNVVKKKIEVVSLDVEILYESLGMDEWDILHPITCTVNRFDIEILATS